MKNDRCESVVHAVPTHVQNARMNGAPGTRSYR